jgi:photosystem II stability/assembly factor-like uncharacterized protein
MLASASTSHSQTTWQSVGPYGGWINDLAKDNTGRIYAATSFGGIYRTDNNGESWNQIYNDTLRFDSRSIATNSNGDIFVGSEGIFGIGFLRSTDDGANWELLSNALISRGAADILVTDTDEIFACTFFDDGIYHSTDNGTTFNEITSFPSSFAAKIKTNSVGALFVATRFNAPYLYRSTDNATTWESISTGITTEIADLCITVTDVMYVASGQEVLTSTNSGDSWTALPVPGGYYFAGITVDGDGRIYASYVDGLGEGGMVSSADEGLTWVEESGLPTKTFANLLAAGSVVYAGGFGPGVYRRPEGGVATWEQKVNGMANTSITSFARDLTSNLVYAGTEHQQVFRSSDLGLSWEPAAFGIPDHEWIYDLAVNIDGTVFAGGSYGNIYRSFDQGTTWTSVFPVSATAIECNAGGDVFAGYGPFVYRSTNNGESWTSTILPSVTFISDIAFEGQTAYVATGTPFGFGSQGVFRSLDSGVVWETFNDGLTDLNVSTILPRDTAYTGSCPPTSIGTEEGVFDLEGETWILKGSTGSTLKAMARLKQDDRSADYWLGLTAATLFAREDTAAPPIYCGLIFLMSTSFSPSRVEILPPYPSDSQWDQDVVYLVGSAGHGIQRALNIISSVLPQDELPIESSLSQNYPNPFNPSTTIAYEVDSRQPVVLSIYDILGREIATVVNKTQDPGSYEVRWDATGQSSGVYFYYLKSGTFVETRKLVLVR